MKTLKLLLCFLISGICLLLTFRKVNAQEVIHLLSLTNYTWLFIATFIGVLKIWLTGFRCRYLLQQNNQLSTTNSFYFYAVGIMTNMFLPLRAGDLVRLRLIAESLKISNTKVLGAIVSEHILDFSILCLLLGACIIFYSYRWPTQVGPIVATFICISSLIFIGIFIVSKNTHIIQRVKNKLMRVLPKRLLFLPDIIGNFYSGFFQFGNLFNILKIIGITICVWITQGLWIFTLFLTLGIRESSHFGFEATLVLMVMMGIAAMIPSSPSYIGTFHLMVMLGLTQMDVSNPVALSYAILAHAHAVGVAVVIGLFSIWKGKIKLSFDFNLSNKPATTQEAL